MSDIEAETGSDPTGVAETAGRRLGRGAAALVGAAFVLAAIAITIVEPGDAQIESPFLVDVTALNRQVEARDFVVTVSDAALADRVTGGDWVGETDGVWLVVDITFAARYDRAALLGTMTIGPNDYLASSRVDDADLARATSEPGLPWARSVVFELPRAILDSPDAQHAEVKLASSIDSRLDSVVRVTFDLTDLDHESSLVIEEPGRVTG